MIDARHRERLLAIWVVLASLLATPGLALGHAELVSSTPADGATLDAPPTQVVLIFDDELDPDHSAFFVIGPSGTEVGTGEVDLVVADRNVMRGAVHALPAEGLYVVEWVAAAVDGDKTTGSLSFTVSGANSVGNSAVVAPNRHNGLTEAGLILLAAGLAWLAWRRPDHEVTS